MALRGGRIRGGWERNFRALTVTHVRSGREITQQLFDELSDQALDRLAGVFELERDEGKEKLMATGNSFNITNATSGGAYVQPYQNFTASGISAYPVQGFPPPNKRWHNFPCGHQIELEQTQPVPGCCSICGPVKSPEMEVYTYQKCGHPYSYTKGMGAPPPDCPTCAFEVRKREKEQEEKEMRLQAEKDLREAEDKEPLAWLDKQVGDVQSVGVV